MCEKRLGIQYVTSLPTDEVCVGMVNYRDRVIVATSKGVYHLVDDKLVPIEFELPADIFACTECDGVFRYDGIYHPQEHQWGGLCDTCGFTTMFDKQPPDA